MIQPDPAAAPATASTGTDSPSGSGAPTLRGPEAGQRVFGRYVLERILGRGGMGVVWAARDETLGERVALKFLPDAVRWDPAAFDDLKAETRRARSLTHPNIVRIHDFVEDASAAAISMELVDGKTLTELRLEKPSKIFEPADIAPWLPQLCAALDYAHTQARVVHRDLKPANLMLTRDGTLKVADFGVARSLVDSITRVSMMSAGTLVYMSPQQAMGEEPSPADDIYSLGATLYELLTGKPPFHTGDVRMQLFQRKPDAIAARRKAIGISDGGELPPAWEETIAACLDKNAAARPATASAIAAEVGRALRARQSSLTPRRHAISRARSARPTRRTAALVASMALTIQLAVWSLWPGPDYAGAQEDYPRRSRSAPPTRLISRIAFDDDARDEGGQLQEISGGQLVPVLDRHGQIDRAMLFSGSSSVRADAGPDLRWSVRTPFSVAAWVRPDAIPPSGCQLITHVPGDVGSILWQLELAQEGRPVFDVSRNHVENPARRPPIALRALVPGRWHHLAGVSDGREARLFVDGELTAWGPIMDADAPAPSQATFYIGGGLHTIRNWFVGAIDEARIYRGALTAVEVRALARAAPARFVRSASLFDDNDDITPGLRAEFGPDATHADWHDFKVAAGTNPARLAEQLGMVDATLSLFVTRAGERTFDGRRFFMMHRFNGTKPDYYLAHDELGGHVISLGSWFGSRQAVIVRLPLPPPRIERVDFNAPLPAGWTLNDGALVSDGRLNARGVESGVARPAAAVGDTVGSTWRVWFEGGGRAMGTRIEFVDRHGEAWVAACESIAGRSDMRISLGRRSAPERVIEIRPTYGELRCTLVVRGGALRWRVTTAGASSPISDERLEVPGLTPAGLSQFRWTARAEPGAATWLAEVEWREESNK